jgi:hypothetical protein
LYLKINFVKKKTIILILIAFTSFCFAQKNKGEAPLPAKPSTTACPTWNKKNKNTKAAYFEYLRSPKTKANQQTTLSKSQKAHTKETAQKTENTTQKKYLIHSVKKNNLSNKKSDKEIVASEKSEKKEIISNEKDGGKKEETNSTNAPTTIESKGETKDKNKPDNSKIKKKLTFMSRKTTKVHKHSNAKCPSF